MILAILGLLSAVATLVNTLVQKYGSDKHTPTFKRGAMKLSTMTLEEMAKFERKRQQKLLREENKDGNF